MLDTLLERLKAARDAVFRAEADVEETIERSPERLAVKQLEEKKSDLASAELAVKEQELAELQAELAEALAEKTTLHRRIKHTMEVLLPDMAALDDLEIRGAALNSQAFTLAMEIPGAPRGSHWCDPKLSGAAMLLRTWLGRLEG